MNCPVCTSDLRAVDRDGVEIDYCPRCRGVWLDRGELEKIIAQSARYNGGDYDDDDSDWGDPRRQNGRHPPPPGQYPYAGGPPPAPYPPKKKGFFDRLFDFD